MPEPHTSPYFTSFAISEKKMSLMVVMPFQKGDEEALLMQQSEHHPVRGR